jgi:hypothetical protein
MLLLLLAPLLIALLPLLPLALLLMLYSDDTSDSVCAM